MGLGDSRQLEDTVDDSTSAEDAALARAIAEGLNTETVSRRSVMEALQDGRDEAPDREGLRRPYSTE